MSGETASSGELDPSLERLVAEVASAPERLAEARPPDPRPGDRIGRFEVIRELGRGGFGVVYEARDTELGRGVALKVLRLDRLRRAGVDEREVAARLHAEARAGALLQHRNIVTVFDYGTWNEAPVVVLELLRGESLAARLQRGRLPPRAVLELGAQLAAALAHAHAAGVVHCDLKPSNVFLADDGEARLLDLGLARVAGALGPPGAPLAGGTPAYMAPEQRAGHADARSDLFSLGVTLFEAATGALPHHPGPAGAQLPGGPPDELARTIARLLEPDPARRLAPAGAALEALAAAARSLDGAAVSDEPFRYLEAFTARDASWFFGREREAARLRQLLDGRPLVALVGPSGAGKSSLMQAGLAPSLSYEEPPWAVLMMRPGADPLASLAARIAELTGETTRGEGLLARPGLAGELLRAHARTSRRRVLVIVDGLEELFTHDVERRVRDAFAAALLSVADDPSGPLRVLVAIREDFLGRLGEGRPLAEAVAAGVFILGAPSESTLAEALIRPARRAGYEVEPALAAEIAASISGEAAPLPLLQLAASHLWEGRDRARRAIVRAPLDAAGGVPGLLAAHADRVVDALPAEEVALARRVAGALVTPERTRRQVDRAALLSRLPARAAVIVQRLVDGRLLTAAATGGRETVELAHESLVARWDRLRRWLDEDEHESQLAEAVETAARAWADNGRPAALLWRGAQLDEIVAWRRRGGLPHGELSLGFVAASETRRRRRRRLLRISALAGAVAAIAGAVGLSVALRAARLEARATRVRAAVAAASAASDPAVAAQVLLELARDGEPPGGADLAHRLLAAPLPRRILRGHEDQINEVSFSPDGTLLLTASRDTTARIWRLTGQAPPLVLAGDGGTARDWVETARFSPDGARAVTASHGGTLRVFDAAGRAPPVTLCGCGDTIYTAVFSPDGSRVAAVVLDGSVSVWRSDGRGARVTLGRHEGYARLRWAPDGERLFTIGSDGSVRSWDARGGAAQLVIGAAGAVTASDISSDASRLVLAYPDGSAKIFDLRAAGEPVVLHGHRDAVTVARFSPDGARLLTASRDGTARVWTVDGNTEPVVLGGHQASIQAGDFSPDGSWVATASLDGTARVARADGRGAALVLRGHVPVVRDLAFSPDNHWLATVDETVRLWRLDPSPEPVVLGGHGGFVSEARFLRGDTRVVTSSWDGAVRLFDSETGQLLGVVDLGLRDIEDIDVAADGALVASAHDGDAAVLWRLDPRSILLPFPLAHGRPVSEVRFTRRGDALLTRDSDGTLRLFPLAGGPPRVLAGGLAGLVPGHKLDESPDGKWLVVALEDRTARILPAGGGAPRVLAGHTAPITCVAASADGKLALTGSEDGTARVWSVDGGAVTVLSGHTRGILDCAFAPDGAHVLTASSDRTARVWSLGGGAPVVLEGHRDQIRAAEFSADGRWVVTGSDDNTARVWPAAGGASIVLAGHESHLLAVAFSADGRRVVTAAKDGTARVWRVAWDDLVSQLRSQAGGCLSATDRVSLLGVSPARAALGERACESGRAD